MMFWSDATQLTAFGDAKLWPLYVYFGNESKYQRCTPTANLCSHAAYFQAVHVHVLQSFESNFFLSFQSSYPIISRTSLWSTLAVINFLVIPYSLIVTESCSMHSGGTFWMMNSFMHTNMGWCLHVGTISRGGSFLKSLLIQQIIQKSVSTPYL